MNWTALYLKTSGLKVFILGTGEVATRRANKFLDHGATVKLAGSSIDDELKAKTIEFRERLKKGETRRKLKVRIVLTQDIDGRWKMAIPVNIHSLKLTESQNKQKNRRDRKASPIFLISHAFASSH